MPATRSTTSAVDNETQIQLALQEYTSTKDQGGKLATIARSYHVSRSTLYRRLNGVESRQSISQTNQKLTPSQEQSLKDHILEMESQHRSYDITTLTNEAEQLFPQHSFNRKWVSRFCQRHNLKPRCDDQGSENYHVFKVNKQSITEYYQVLQEAIDSYHIQPYNLYSVDETCVWMGGNRSRRRAITTTSARTENSPLTRETCTAIETICADGSSIPTAIILAGKVARSNYLDGAQDTMLLMTLKGYNSKENMLKWVQHFNHHTLSKISSSSQEWRLLILDGATVHLGLDFFNYCKDNRICLFTFPTHLSRIFQSLSKVVFSPLKTRYNQLCHRQLTHATLGNQKQMIASFWNRAKIAIVTPDLIKQAFSKVGIHPFNASAIDLESLERISPPPVLDSTEVMVSGSERERYTRQLETNSSTTTTIANTSPPPVFDSTEVMGPGSGRERLSHHIRQLETNNNNITTTTTTNLSPPVFDSEEVMVPGPERERLLQYFRHLETTNNITTNGIQVLKYFFTRFDTVKDELQQLRSQLHLTTTSSLNSILDPTYVPSWAQGAFDITPQ